MKIRNVLLSISVVILTLSCEAERTAEMIVNESLEKAYGGKANWEKPTTLIYEKTTILYDSLGNVESQKKQLFHNTLQPEFTSTVSWTENDLEKRIVFDGKDTFLFVDNFEVIDEKQVANAHKEIMGAQYVLWQPYKLLADKAVLESEGKFRLEDGHKAYKIKVNYPDSDAEWWYYFDAETFLLKENLVKHGATYSQIKNIQHESKTGLRLHKERKSFMIDVEKNQKYLRAYYFYTILELK